MIIMIVIGITVVLVVVVVPKDWKHTHVSSVLYMY